MFSNAPTKNPTVLAWLEDKIKLVNPDKVVWIDGSEEQLEALRAEAVATGELEKLQNGDKADGVAKDLVEKIDDFLNSIFLLPTFE